MTVKLTRRQQFYKTVNNVSLYVTVYNSVRKYERHHNASFSVIAAKSLNNLQQFLQYLQVFHES